MESCGGSWADFCGCGAWPRADALFRGEEASAVYLVSAGVLRVYSAFPDGRRQIHRFARAGEMLGLTFDAAYPYNSDAVGNAAVLKMERDRLDEALRHLARLRPPHPCPPLERSRRRP